MREFRSGVSVVRERRWEWVLRKREREVWRCVRRKV